MRLVVMASGRGSNLQAILDAIASRRLDAEVAAVVSDQEGAAALDRAERAGVRGIVVRRSDFGSRREWDRALGNTVEGLKPDLVVLAGFMRILKPEFLDRLPGKVINIHPSLLPSFPGLEAQKQALDYGVKYSGCTVHYVDEGCDSGPIIDQRVVQVLPDDDVESLSDRILKQEHELLVDVLVRLAAQRKGCSPCQYVGR